MSYIDNQKEYRSRFKFINLRITENQHKLLKQVALDNNISVNRLITHLIEDMEVKQNDQIQCGTKTK